MKHNFNIKNTMLGIGMAVVSMTALSTAQADVTIYGKVHASIDYINPDSSDSLTDVMSRSTYVGFKGSEDLGNGTSVIWKMESEVNMTDDSTQYLTARNAYIGMSGKWGTLLYGRHDTPLKMSTARLDIFEDTIADYNGTQGSTAMVAVNSTGFTDIRANDAVAYISPVMFNGLTVSGAIVPDADYDGTGDTMGGYSVAATYTYNSLYIGGGYEDLSDLANGNDISRVRVGVGYTFNNLYVGAVYEREAILNDDVNKVQLSTSYTLGNTVIKGMWMDANDYDFKSIPDSGVSWAVGIDHNYSKRTTAYVVYADSDAGLYDKAGKPGSALSVGIKHAF